MDVVQKNNLNEWRKEMFSCTFAIIDNRVPYKLWDDWEPIGILCAFIGCAPYPICGVSKGKGGYLLFGLPSHPALQQGQECVFLADASSEEAFDKLFDGDDFLKDYIVKSLRKYVKKGVDKALGDKTELEAHLAVTNELIELYGKINSLMG